MVVVGGGMQGRPGAIIENQERQNSKELGWFAILSMSKIWVNSTQLFGSLSILYLQILVKS